MSVCFSLIGAPEDPRREDPDNFLLVFGAYNISDVTDEQILGIDLIVKVPTKSCTCRFVLIQNDVGIRRSVLMNVVKVSVLHLNSFPSF